MGVEERDKGRRIGEALTEARFWKDGAEELLKVAAAHGVTVTGVMLRGDEESLEGVERIEVVEGVWTVWQDNGAVVFLKESAVAGVFGPDPNREPRPQRTEPDGDGEFER